MSWRVTFVYCAACSFNVECAGCTTVVLSKWRRHEYQETIYLLWEQESLIFKYSNLVYILGPNNLSSLGKFWLEPTLVFPSYISCTVCLRPKLSSYITQIHWHPVHVFHPPWVNPAMWPCTVCPSRLYCRPSCRLHCRLYCLPQAKVVSEIIRKTLGIRREVRPALCVQCLLYVYCKH